MMMMKKPVRILYLCWDPISVCICVGSVSQEF
ncbi:hypothetical protein Q3G72_022820 [Acer saccharum]|nr:hypothetical protein Q3G72_022820 [Acer saccharum]